MEITSNNIFGSFISSLAHEKFDVWNGPKVLNAIRSISTTSTPLNHLLIEKGLRLFEGLPTLNNENVVFTWVLVIHIRAQNKTTFERLTPRYCSKKKLSIRIIAKRSWITLNTHNHFNFIFFFVRRSYPPDKLSWNARHNVAVLNHMDWLTLWNRKVVLASSLDAAQLSRNKLTQPAPRKTTAPHKPRQHNRATQNQTARNSHPI